LTGREPAWRLLAGELETSVEEERGEGERAASYVLSPIGARMNRVLLAGTLGPAESAGKDPAQPFWRARFTDPSGSVTVTAGSFQPRALGQLQTFTSPSGALVVGKPHLFHTRDGTTIASVRAEEIRAVDANELRTLQLEAALATLTRVDLCERFRRGSPGIEEECLREGFAASWIGGARAATARYPSFDLHRFRERLGSTLGTPVAPTPASRRRDEVAPSASARVTRRVIPEPEKSRPRPDRAKESVFLDIVDELAEGSEDGYADLREVARIARGRGVVEHQVEELLSSLEENGVLEEPIVGKLRRS
jgi:uncharacterized protein